MREGRLHEQMGGDWNRTRDVGAHAAMAEIVTASEGGFCGAAFRKQNFQADIDPMAGPTACVFAGTGLGHRGEVLLCFLPPTSWARQRGGRTSSDSNFTSVP